MRRPAFVSVPARISIGDEPLNDSTGPAPPEPLIYGRGLEIIPAWQARPPRRSRRLLPGVAITAVAAAAAFWPGRSDDARALRARPATAAAFHAGRAQAIVAGAAASRDAHPAGHRR